MRKQEIIASSARTGPNPPTIISATDVGTSRAYNNAQIDVVVSAPFDGKLPIGSYSATSTPGSITGSSATTTIPVAGLLSATSYTFVARATNPIASSANSSPSGSVLATTVPQNPTIGTASNVTGRAFATNPNLNISFSAANTGGKSISSYKYSTNGGTTFASASGTTSPITLTTQSTGTAFAAGTDYNVILRAVNLNGDSTSSGTSNAARAATVPQAPSGLSATRVSNTQVSISFSPNNNGGSTLISVAFTSSPSVALSFSGTTSPITVTGTFVLNQAYTFTMTSTNSAGTSLSSSASNSVIPNPSVVPNFATPNFPNFPNFATPNFPNFPNFATPNFPNFPNFATPNFPNFPNFATPNFPNFPNFASPNFPNFATPNFPNFPNFASPNFPNFASCSPPVGSTCDFGVPIGFCGTCSPYMCYRNLCIDSSCNCSTPCGNIFC